MRPGRSSTATRPSSSITRSYSSQSGCSFPAATSRSRRRSAVDLPQPEAERLRVRVVRALHLGAAVEHGEPPHVRSDEHDRAAGVAGQVVRLRVARARRESEPPVHLADGDEALLRHPVAPERREHDDVALCQQSVQVVQSGHGGSLRGWGGRPKIEGGAPAVKARRGFPQRPTGLPCGKRRP